jgi:hypothetical protein
VESGVVPALVRSYSAHLAQAKKSDWLNGLFLEFEGIEEARKYLHNLFGN